jgi:uncharacterized damage-inducible protein DinB
MKAQLSATLDNSRNYTLAVAEALPGKEYSFKPTEEVWSFGELLNHMGYGIHWWESNFIRKEKADWNPPALPTGKDEVKQYLQAAYDQLLQTINTVELNETAVQGFYATIDHITHHRGQATTYLRLKGIVPPEYVY